MLAKASSWRLFGIRCFSQVTVSQARLQEFIRAELSYFASRHTKALRLEQIVEASTPGKVARLVHKELPYRFAARIKHIESVAGWERQLELRQLQEIFMDSFSDLRLAEPPDTEEESSLTVQDLKEYTEVIRSVRKRHMPVVALLAEAVRKMTLSDPWMEGDDFQSWADTFLVSRISTEMLTSHYMAVVEWHDSVSEAAELLGSDHIGIVDTKCNPGKICEEAAKAVQAMYSNSNRQVYGNLKVEVHSHSESGSEDAIAFSYIPKYLFYIVQELIENSARATVEACEVHSRRSLSERPIVVTVFQVCADQKQVAIRIADQGGGIPFGKNDEIWSYLFSTSTQPFQEYLESGSPLAGWGVGLALGRLYARYLGGSLQLMNVPGTGVDAYLFLRRIDPSAVEGIPRTSISDSVAPGTSYDCFGVVQRLSKISMAEIDVSVFSKMAELLARPLSPTALEKEEAAKTQNGKRVPKAKVPSRKAAARPKAESKAAASMQAAAPLIKEADAEEPMTNKEHSTFSEDKGGLQQEWKEKMKHPAFRKGGPPRMKRPPAPAVLDEEERRQKMEEIDTLEVQLKEAKTLAAAAKRAAQAAEQLAEAAAKEVESGSEDGQISQSTEPKKELPEGDLQQQAEARVKARKRQEAKEQRDRQRKEAEEKRLKQAEAEAKAKELERHAKERIQERIRSERARERQQQEELEREAEFKEQRSRQVAEELQQQALKRLSDKEHAEKHLADELAKAEAEAKRLQAQENHARAEELRQKTRRRVQQYTRQQRDQSMAQEEARRKRMEEEAQVAEDKIMQAIRSQERAKARATEFKHRERSVEKAKAMLQGEQEVRQQELAEVAQLERQRKRHWRAELARRPATPLRSDISSRASSHPPLTRPAPRPADLCGGRSAESSRASTPNCPMWAIVDSAGNEEGHRPKPQLPKPTQESVKKVPLQRLTRAVSQPPIRPKAVERVEHVEPVVPRVQSSGSGDQSRASTPVDHWDEPDFVEEVTAYPENPRLNSAKAPSLDEASVPSSPGGKSPKPWKQRAIQVNSTEHYLEALKAARGHQPKAAKSRPAPGSKGYAEQLRLRAEDVEAKQREEEDVRMERGYAALQRVQQRALQASPMRGARAG